MKLTITPNKEASDYLRGKAVAMPEAFGRLPGEIKGRAFTVARIHDFDLLRDMKARLATLPEGGDWREIRKGLAQDLTPDMGDGEDAPKEARAKAELLLRTHGFQAYAAGRYSQQVATRDALPFWQWLTVGDGRVRAEHMARDGMTLRADDPFWAAHYPPDDWGCRCIVVAITEAEAAERDVIAGDEAERVSEAAAKAEAEAAGAERPAAGRDYTFKPGELKIDLAWLKARYAPDVFAAFSETMKQDVVEVDGERVSVWEWLGGEAG